ncbi:hypothetical protein CAEBREN_24697 [Caenorhabditis brenneri]|uniref:Uncharacterized protein n=1 Tax=Caenorhabditis brenneri TaxID=135651 RepID=G0NI99_CAEBE|nr:hypothetical protein CAEBREN_24697 [Caenorhabditis brenneri]
MEIGDDGIINYHRSENTFDPEFFVKTRFENLHPKFPEAFMMAVALMFLTGLVAHESIQIKTMEWELSSEGLLEEEKDMARNVINYFVETNTFRVEEIVLPKNNDDSFSCIVGICENMIGLKSFRRLGIIVSGESLVPQVAHDFIWKDNDGTTCVDDMIVSHVAESKCGFTTQKMHATYENEFIEEFDEAKKSKTTEPEVMVVSGEITPKSVDVQFSKSIITEEVKLTAYSNPRDHYDQGRYSNQTGYSNPSAYRTGGRQGTSDDPKPYSNP